MSLTTVSNFLRPHTGVEIGKLNMHLFMISICYPRQRPLVQLTIVVGSHFKVSSLSFGFDKKMALEGIASCQCHGIQKKYMLFYFIALGL